MTDIVELLRCISVPFTAKPVVEQAADEIDRLRAALDAAADEIDCGCPNRDAALAAESKADLWRACHLGPSCNARQAADIRSMKDRTP
jgi:hypothetical protein